MNRRGICFVAISLSFLLITPSMAQVGRGRFGLGLSLAGNTLNSDWKTNDLGWGASADMSYGFGDWWGLVSRLALNRYTGKNLVNQRVLSTVFSGDVGLRLDLLPSKSLDPFVFGRVGLAFYVPRIDNGPALAGGVDQMWDLAVGGGVGVDIFLDKSWSLIVTAEVGTLTNDQIDGYKLASSIDRFGGVSIGVRYYLFDRFSVERIVEEVLKH
jgi:hypothetical protein